MKTWPAIKQVITPAIQQAALAKPDLVEGEYVALEKTHNNAPIYKYAKLESQQSNAANRFKKRGYWIMPVKYSINTRISGQKALIAVFPDGSVTVDHSGLEKFKS